MVGERRPIHYESEWREYTCGNTAVVFCSKTFDVYALSLGELALVLVFEGDVNPRSIRGNLIVLNFHVQLDDLGNAQVAQRLARLFNGILCPFLP